MACKAVSARSSAAVDWAAQPAAPHQALSSRATISSIALRKWRLPYMLLRRASPSLLPITPRVSSSTQTEKISGAALSAYGPKFRYSHWAGTKTLRYAAGGATGVGAVALAAQVKPLRNLLLGRIKQGEGPDASKREKSWFTVDFIGEGDGRSIHTRVSGGDPGYGETAKMLAESALCLAFDDNPTTAGQVTTAQAMGDNLLARLHAAGITFEALA